MKDTEVELAAASPSKGERVRRLAILVLLIAVAQWGFVGSVVLDVMPTLVGMVLPLLVLLLVCYAWAAAPTAYVLDDETLIVTRRALSPKLYEGPFEARVLDNPRLLLRRQGVGNLLGHHGVYSVEGIALRSHISSRKQVLALRTPRWEWIGISPDDEGWSRLREVGVIGNQLVSD